MQISNMKTRFLALAAVVALSAQAAAASSDQILTLPHKEAMLPNGLKVFMVKYPSPGVVAYQVAVHAGSRNEVEKGKTGFAHFFEHLMFRGTKHLTAKQFGELYVKLGNENNAWTGNDMTDYHGVVASIYLAKILAAEADRFANLSFPEKLLRDEAGAVLGEYNKDVANPDFQMEEKLDSLAFTVHPYAHTTMGYKEDILKFPERYKDVWPFFKRYYRPGNVSVTLVGDIDFKRDLAAVAKEFGEWKNPTLSPVDIPAEPEQSGERSGEIKLDKPTQTRIDIAYHVPAFTTKNTDAAALALLSEMLFSTTSEFQKEYRFDRKWVDSVGASPPDSVDPGLWIVSLRLSQDGEGHEQDLKDAVGKALAALRESPPDAKRLEDTKRRFRNGALTGWFSSPESLASRIAVYANLEPDLGVLDRVFERLAEVKPETLTAFAKAHLVDGHKTTVTLRGAGQ